MTVGITIHDKMSNLRPNGVGGGNLRHELWERFWKIYHQRSINGLKLGERSNSNSKGAIKLKGIASEQHLVI